MNISMEEHIEIQTKLIKALEQQIEELSKGAKELNGLRMIKEDYEKALDDIDKRDTILMKLGLAASENDTKLYHELGGLVLDMRKTSAANDMDIVVDELYSSLS